MNNSIVLYFYRRFRSLSKKEKSWNLILFGLCSAAVLFDGGLNQGSYMLFGFSSCFCLVFLQISTLLVVLNRLEMSLFYLLDIFVFGTPALTFELVFGFGSKLLLCSFLMAVIMIGISYRSFPRRSRKR